MVHGANSRSGAEQFSENIEFFAGGAEAGFLPKKEPSANFPEEIRHFFWQLLYPIFPWWPDHVGGSGQARGLSTPFPKYGSVFLERWDCFVAVLLAMTSFGPDLNYMFERAMV